MINDGTKVFAVGDPSVLVEYIQGKKQYTMFLTVCVDRSIEHNEKLKCRQQDNEIWSVISNDGINWNIPVKFITNTTPGNEGLGSGEPSVIIDNKGKRHYKIYYNQRTPETSYKIQVSYADGLRKLIRMPDSSVGKTVYTNGNEQAVSPDSFNMVSSPEVEFINNKWMLIFNNWGFNGDELKIDIYKIKSDNNEKWLFNDRILVVNHDRTKNYFEKKKIFGVLPLVQLFCRELQVSVF